MERKGENSGEAGDEIHDVKDLLPGGASSLAGRGESWAFTLGARNHDPFPGCNVSNVTSLSDGILDFECHNTDVTSMKLVSHAYQCWPSLLDSSLQPSSTWSSTWCSTCSWSCTWSSSMIFLSNFAQRLCIHCYPEADQDEPETRHKLQSCHGVTKRFF